MNTGLLILNLQNVQSDSTFDLTKLTYSDGIGGTHSLAGTYTKAYSKPEVENNLGKYFFDSVNNKLILNLTEEDYQAIDALPDFVINGLTTASDTISAEAGWNTWNSIPASAVTAQTVTVQN